MDAVSKHHCYYRDDSRGSWNTLRDWYLVPAHFLATVAVCLGLLLGVDGRIFAVDAQATAADRLRQSDVVTIVSAGLVVVRLLATAWLSLAGWRMGFIVMEKGGATLTQLDRLITYRVPMFRMASDRSGPRSGPRYSRPVLIVLWLIFILATPSLFIAPLASGAITWNPYTSGDVAAAENGVKISTAGATRAARDPYSNFEDFQHNRNFVVQRAVGLASLAPPTDFTNGTDNTSPPSRRRIPSEIDRAVGTRLGNVSVPSFVIHALDWVQSRSDLSNDDLETLYQAGVESAFPQMNITSDLNPLCTRDGTDIGTLATILPGPWEPETQTVTGNNRLDRYYSWPSAKTVTDSYLVLVLTHRNDTANYEPFNQCGDTISPRFGETKTIAPWLFFNPDTSQPQCYAIARVKFTAGVLECTDCPITSSGAVEYSAPPYGQMPGPDALTSTAVAMMPEVLINAAVANSSLAPTWDNLAGYTRGMLAVSYQAAWNALANEFLLPDDLAQSTTVSPPVTNRLQALVTHWRVYVWGALNALVAVSGLLLAFLQRGCQGKTVSHPPVSALLLDASPVLRGDFGGVCNAASPKGSDCEQGLHLRVRHPESRYRHPVLVPGVREKHHGDVHVAFHPVNTRSAPPSSAPPMSPATPYRPHPGERHAHSFTATKHRSMAVVSSSPQTDPSQSWAVQQTPPQRPPARRSLPVPTVSPLSPVGRSSADDAALLNATAPMAYSYSSSLGGSSTGAGERAGVGSGGGGLVTGAAAGGGEGGGRERDTPSWTYARHLDVPSPGLYPPARRWRASEALAPSTTLPSS